MPAARAAPIPIRPFLSFTATLLLAQRTAVQDTVQFPRKRIQIYRDPLHLRAITADVRMVPHYVPQAPYFLPTFRRLPSLPENATVLLSLHTFHFSHSERHMQSRR
jgi:hypothetical protein